MTDFTKLIVWEKAHKLTLNIYKITEAFPSKELYSLTQQLRRCASSIPANIAEGSCRNGDREFAQFLQISMGSASETKYFIILAKDLEYIDSNTYELIVQNIDEVQKILSVFINRLRKKNN